MSAAPRKGTALPDPPPSVTPADKGISLDTWAVLAAVLAAALIRIGCVTRVPW